MGNISVFNLLSVSTERIYHPNELNCYNVALLASSSDTDAAQLPVDPAWLVAALSALVATRQVPGAQLAIHRAGATVAVEVGGLEHRTGTPVTQETAFPIGSFSKMWAATPMMILIADDDLELDAPLDIHLPELGDVGSKLTLGQLLSYTSGFACSLDMREHSAGSLGRYARDHCRAQDLIFPSGTGFSYSDRNYVVVGRLIETITGMSCSEIMESTLLRPQADPFGLADVWGSGLALFRGATTDWVGHDGNTNGTSCYLRIDPAGRCVVALITNANTGSHLWDELRIKPARANLSLGAHQRDMSPLDEQMLDHLAGNRDRRHHRPRTPGLPAGFQPLRLRDDFGVSSTNLSELGGFEAFFEPYPSQVSNSAIRTRATPNSADNTSISSSRCASSSSNSTTNGVSSTVRSSTPRTTRPTNHADHQDLTIYGTKVGPCMATTG